MTVQQIINAIMEYSNPPFVLEHTCDKLMAGCPETEVTGVVTTFMATVEVIRKAVKLGANLIITHEPTWFSGADETGWLKGDPVYGEKLELIEQNKIAVWRYHDHMHMHKPDAIYVGLLKELGWEQYAKHLEISAEIPVTPGIPADFVTSFQDYYDIPKTTLGKLSEFFKVKLGMGTAQIVGDADMSVERVGILVGGGSLGLGSEIMPMQVMQAHDIHVMVCGDITEWTLPAYVNDAYQLGHRRALLIIGHERSEEWGMKYMAEWLPSLIGGTKTVFVSAEEPFSYI